MKKVVVISTSLRPGSNSHAMAERLAERLCVKNLILYHTEDQTLDNRKQKYTAEAKSAFSGNVFVPDDLEKILF